LKLGWSQRAQNDLVEIASFIARDDPAAARAWVKRLRKRAQLAVTMPYGGRVVPEQSDDDIREVFVRSYRIIYRIQGRQTIVLTVLEGHRILRESMLDEQ
jgi:toxin ParE1/3/4